MVRHMLDAAGHEAKAIGDLQSTAADANNHEFAGRLKLYMDEKKQQHSPKRGKGPPQGPLGPIMP